MKKKNNHIVKGKLEDAERLKKQSNYLRGTIVEDLKNDITGGFNGDNFSLIRFHGMYQQDDRDIRKERQQQKLEPRYAMMLRCRLPGGIITPKQWLAIDKFSQENTIYESIRLTNRQTFQFHGILKKKLKLAHNILHQIGLDSIATANDVNRNVLCTSNPIESELHQSSWQWAKKISEHLLPKTNAYAEIWLNKKKIESTEHEPILGNTYLPRKFKTALVIPPYNDVDIHANDMGFIAIANSQNKLIGFNVLVGGGLSIEHGNKLTYPRLASELGFIELKNTLKIAEAIVTIQRDWGNRTNRKNAKTRYTIERVGLDVFKKEIEKRSKIIFEKIHPYHFKFRGDRLGWVKGIDDNWHMTLFIENGRIIDSANYQLKTAIAEIAKIHSGDFRLTANQNLIIANVNKEKKHEINKIIQKYKLINDITKQRKNSMACVSFPTCPLAMAEAERFLPLFISKIEKIINKFCNLQKDYIVLRVTGCPNGCARSLLAEIGLIGKGPGRYNLYIGGNKIGTRIPKLYKENITENEIIFVLENLIKKWSIKRYQKESFGDFVIRTKIVKPVLNSSCDFW